MQFKQNIKIDYFVQFSFDPLGKCQDCFHIWSRPSSKEFILTVWDTQKKVPIIYTFASSNTAKNDVGSIWFENIQKIFE